MKKQFQSLTEKGRWLIATLTLLFTLGIGQMWADLTAHIPGVYEKATNKGGYGCTLTTVASGENAGTFEVYYFSAQSKYSENTTVYNEGTKQQYRLMCADGDSEYQLINRNGTGTFTASCDWIEMAYGATGFSKSDYTFGSNKFNEFFEITPNGGNTGITKTCYIKPKQGDVLTLKVSGYVEFAILGNDNGSSKYMTISVDGGTPTSWKSNTLSRRAVSLTTGEHTIVVACVGNSANAFYGFSLKLPSCDATAPGNISKGALSAGILTLQVADDPKTGDEFYWQTSATGTTKNKTGENINFGKTYQVSAAGTYYIRSYNTSDDCWSEAKSITITATDLVSNYTVKYMDGTTELGSEAVEVGEHPTGSGITTPTKDCYTFAGWDPALSGVSGSDGDEIEVNATWTPKYASTLDFAAVTTAGTTGSNPIGTFLASGNMVASNLGSNSGWETSTAKSGFIGYKVKNTNAVIKFLVKAGKEVEITLGSVGAAAKLNKGGVESEIAKKSGDNEQTVIPAFVAESDMLVTITTNASSNSTVTLKKISIVDPAPKYTVTYALNGATGTTPTEVSHKEGEKFNLHDGATGITAPANKTFVNWKDQDNNEFAGGAEYTMPGENVTLTAQWAGDVYTVKFMDGETVLDTKVVEVGSHPADIEHPTKPLYTFAAWQLSGSDVVLDNVNGTKDATVILTARWAVAYASNVNFKEAATQALGVETALNTYHYASDAGDISFEEKGLKIKTNAARFYFNVAPGKVAEIKFGNISGATYSVDGGAAETLTSSQLKATYSASAQSCVMTMTTAAYNIVEKVTIHDPYQVTFDANEGDPVASQYGYPSITLPSASKGTDSFLGWFIGEDKIGEAGDSYTPTANVELVAHWEAVSSDARLSSITFSSAAGTLSPAFDPEVVNYTYTMPYGTAAIPTITGATSVNANAQDPIIGEAATAWGGSQTIKGVAQSGDKKTYTITMLQAPKDGVCLIKGKMTGDNAFSIDTEASLVDGTPTVSNVKNNSSYGGQTGYKFNSRPARMGLTLAEGTFQEGDIVEVFVTTVTDDYMRVFDANDVADEHKLAEGETKMVQGINRLVLPATSTASLYLLRGAENALHDMWNPYVAYFAVYRPMNPMLTAMTIDGRTVTINEDAKTATVTIPYESDLANLTIAKTIVWNAPAATNSIVVNGGSAWTLGENTYKLTDKDGDATTYTITVARDVLKHTVSFNTHGGSAVASVEIEHNTYLTSVPNDPSKEDYIFQYWSLTDGGEEVDVTTVQINEDKEFHAVWAAETGVVKLLDGEGHVNHTDFITALTEGTVNFDDADHNCVTFGSTTSTVVGQTGANKFIVYNAKTNQTKIKFVLYNTNSSAQKIVLQKIAEGDAAPTDVEIEVPSKERFETSYYTYNSDANRTMYVFTKNTNIKVLQVKVVDDGTPVKQAGEVGYALKLNVGRVFAPSGSAVVYDGLTMNASSNYKVLNSEVLQTQQNISFTVASPVLMTLVSTGAKYQVSTNAAGSGDEYAAGTNEHNLTAGTWYIVSSTGSNMKFTNISFAMPKAAKPVVAAMDDVEYCQGSAIDELAVSATVSDGGTMLYQWYKDGEIIAGAEAANYQPTADGEYYVEVVNTKTGYQNSDAVQSNTITVTGYAATVLSGTTGAENWPGEDATISVTASGKNLHYAWYTCDDAMGANPVAVDPAVDAAELNVTIAAADTYYKVVVSGDCGDAQEAIITVVARQAVELQDVTGNMTWDFSKANDGSAISSGLCNDEVLANVHGINNNDDFKSAYLKATANKFKSGKLQASMIKFHTTVDGMITVVFSNTGNKSQDRYLTVNGRKTDKGTKTETAVTYTGFVYAGDVELGVVEGDGNMLNFTSVQFTATTSYTRPVNPSFLGTLCWTNNAVLGGATLYVFAGKNENNYLVFDEVEENRLEAGKPYIFMPENGNTEIKLYNTDNEAALTEDQAPVNNMYGTITGKTLVPGVDDNMYYFSSNHIWAVKDFAVYIPVPAYYCYVDYAAVLAAEPAPAPAPGRRRVTMGVKGEQVATGFENLNASEKPVKLMINGQMFILRGEKLYDATGRLVK